MDTFTVTVVKQTSNQSEKGKTWFYYAFVYLPCWKGFSFLRINGFEEYENFKYFQVTLPSKSFRENFNNCVIFLAVIFLCNNTEANIKQLDLSY